MEERAPVRRRRRARLLAIPAVAALGLGVGAATAAADPITADFGTGSLLKLNLGVKLDVPLLFALNLPLPPVLVNAQHLLGGLPASLGVDAKGLDINLVLGLL